MALQPIFEKISLSGKRNLSSESVKVECKTSVATQTVGEVLSVWANAVILNHDQKDGQIKCDGRTIYYICYLTVDGEVKKTECTEDFSTLVKDESIKAGYKPYCRAKISKTEFDLSGTSLTVTATLNVVAQTNQTVEIPALSGGEKLVIDTDELTLSKSYGVKEGVYPLEEEFELNCEIKEVLYHRATACISAVQCGVGSIIVDGQVYLTLIALQKEEKSSIIKEIRVIPFRHEIECEEAMPTMSATASVIESGLKTDVLVDPETSKSKVTVGVNLCFTGEAWASEQVAVARDAFSITDNLELVLEQAECVTPCGSQSISVGFNGRASTTELPVGVTLFAIGGERTEILSSQLDGGKLKATGVVTAIGYFCDGEGKLFTRKLETTFEKEVDCVLSGELDGVVVKAERTSARLVSATEVELDGELVFGVNCRERTSIACIKEVKCLGEKKVNTNAISVYIPLEDEELWSLSKRLNVCPEQVVETNPELTFPLTGTERIVVYRKL